MSGIDDYTVVQEPGARMVCEALAGLIAAALPGAEGRVWHGGPVWFLAGNPIVGYWVRKSGVQLLFWSGQSFDAPGLRAEGKFKAAEAVYTDVSQIVPAEVQALLARAAVIQWDYKNIVKRKGVLEKLGEW